MTTGNKNKLFYRFNIIFLMINTAFFVFLWPNITQKTTVSQHKPQFNLEFLKEELTLTDEQFSTLTEMDRQILKKNETILRLLCQNRYRILHELAKSNPSMKELNNTASSAGFLHRTLKKQTIYHLLNVKKICTPEQSKKLDKIFIEILENDKYCKDLCMKQKK